MNLKSIRTALEQIEESVEGVPEVTNAVAVIRAEMARERPAVLDPEKFFAISFEAGRDYLIFIEWGVVEPETLAGLPATNRDYGTFIFVHPDGNPVADKFLVAERGQQIFADSRYVDEVGGVTLVDTGGADIKDIMAVKP